MTRGLHDQGLPKKIKVKLYNQTYIDYPFEEFNNNLKKTY